MKILNKKMIIILVNFFIFFSITTTLAGNNTSFFEGLATTGVFDNTNHKLITSDFGSSSSVTSFSITKNFASSSFTYSGNYNLTNISSGNTWISLKNSSGAFRKILESGSSISKWYLTGIEISYSRYTSTIGNSLTLDVLHPEATSSNSVRIISTTGLTNSTGKSALDANRTSYSNLTLFTKSDNVTSFILMPGATNFVVENITFYYVIDYSNC